MTTVLPKNLHRMVCAVVAMVLASAVVPMAHATPNEFATVVDLMNASGLSGTVRTVNHDTPGDGGGMTFTVQAEAPGGVLENIALPLADGKWAVPQSVASAPSTAINEAAAQDAIARGQTFVDAGKSLIWDASRRSPLNGGVVHQQTSAPYPITCSSFVGMTLLGWDYQHTTYVAQENSAVGYAIDLDVPPEQARIWQAHRLAKWLYTHGDAWLGSEGGYQPGDVLFFSKQSPEGKETTGEYFMNIYHVAIYAGDGMVMHSTGPSAPGGVYLGRIGQTYLDDLSLVVRPNWTGGQDIQPQQPQAETTRPRSRVGRPRSAGACRSRRAWH